MSEYYKIVWIVPSARFALKHYNYLIGRLLGTSYRLSHIDSTLFVILFSPHQLSVSLSRSQFQKHIGLYHGGFQGVS